MKYKVGDKVKVTTGSYKGTVDTISEVFEDRVRLANTNVRKVRGNSKFKRKVDRYLGISLHVSNVVPVTEDGQVSRKVRFVKEGKNVGRILVDGSKMQGDSYYLIGYLRNKNARRQKLER